jgi:DNA-directed RNA polymerase subunit RPC12/RpoP
MDTPDKTKPHSPLLRAAGLLLVGTAVCLLFGSHHSNLVYPPEPVFETSSRVLLWIIGGLAGVIGLICLFARSRFLAAGVVVWFGFSLLIYRIGVIVLGARDAKAYLAVTASDFGLSARSFEVLMALTVGSAVFLALLWSWKHRGIAGFKASCPNCGQHVQCKDADAGREVSCPACKKMFALRKEPELKMTCIFCNGHIQFPTHSLGKKMKCPHCGMDITLKDSATKILQNV